MKKSSLIIFLFILFGSLNLYGQVSGFKYRQELLGVSSRFHSLELPNEVLMHSSFSDLRVIRINDSDTFEEPYFLKTLEREVAKRTKESFSILNKNSKGDLHTFTLKTKDSKTINAIQLDFEQHNFDWKVKLEGSQDNKEWFTVIKDYRILSIKNEVTDYSFSLLNFPMSSYAFYRVSIESVVKPELSNVTMNLIGGLKGKYRKYEPKKYLLEYDEEKKQTIITFELEGVLPVSDIRFVMNDSEDYYRPFKIYSDTDTIKGKKRILYSNVLFRGTLSSLENPNCSFVTTKAKYFKIVINNHNNRPIDIEEVVVTGPIKELTIKIELGGKHYLYYGNSLLSKPVYDLINFRNKIPTNLSVLKVSQVEELDVFKVEKTPLITSVWWLWLVLGVILVLLFLGTLKMMKKVG